MLISSKILSKKFKSYLVVCRVDLSHVPMYFERDFTESTNFSFSNGTVTP